LAPCRSGLSEKNRVFRQTEQILHISELGIESFKCLQQKRRTEAGVCAHGDLRLGKALLDPADHATKQSSGSAAGVHVPGTKESRDQLAALRIEDHQGVVHVLAVKAAEKGQLLGSMGLIIRGIDIENDLLGVSWQIVDIAILEKADQAPQGRSVLS